MNIMKKLQPGTRAGLSAQEAEIGNQLINRLQPTFMAGGEEMMDTGPSVAGGQLSPNVRSNLAFGSLDEALENQYGGINNLMP